MLTFAQLKAALENLSEESRRMIVSYAEAPHWDGGPILATLICEENPQKSGSWVGKDGDFTYQDVLNGISVFSQEQLSRAVCVLIDDGKRAGVGSAIISSVEDFIVIEDDGRYGGRGWNKGQPLIIIPEY
jgi:hypothetical protein